MEINLNLFGKRMMKVYQSALRFVAYMGHGFIGSEHLLWALSQDQGAAGRALRRNGLSNELIEEYLRQYDFDANAGGDYHGIQVSQEVEEVLHLAESRSKAQRHQNLEPEDLLRGILDAGDCAASQLILSLKADPEETPRSGRRYGSCACGNGGTAGGRRRRRGKSTGEVRHGCD